MKKLSMTAALALATIFGALSARADNFAYLSVNGGDFGTLNLNTGVFTRLGNSGQTIGGLAVRNGILYATALHTAAGTLYTVNPANGSLTAVGDSNVSLDCFGSTDSGLFALGTDLNLYSINSATGAATLLGPIGLSFGSWRTLGPSGSQLYYGNGPNLYTLNTTTGASTLVGNMGGPQIGSIVFEGGILYAGQETPDLRVDTLNPATGIATTGAALTGTSNAFYALAPDPLPTSNYDTTVEGTPNLLGYWRFTPASQANSEVNGYTGTFTGNASVGPADSGPSLRGDTSNTAALFNGTSGYVPTSLTGHIDQQGSMIGWFKLGALPSTVGHSLGIADSSTNGNDFGVQIETDNVLRFYTEAGGHASAPDAFTAADLNTWHFFAVTFVAGTSRNIYLDGRLVASNVPAGHVLNTGATFAIGDSLAFPGRFFQGALDEIAVFDRELNAAEVANIYGATTPRKLLNISTRLRVQTGDNALIGGFIILGTEPKRVIVRAIGPSLAGVPGALADPILELHEPGDVVVTNDNWRSDQEAEIIATTIPPSNDLESAIVANLNPGTYTAVVRGKDGGTGIGLVEAYDLSQAADSRMANISTRGFVETGDNAMIGGLIIGPSDGAGTTIVVRAIGPSLTGQGVPNALQDPILELHDTNGNVTTNDNWRATQEGEIQATGLAPTDDHESAILATLAPGNYTAVVRGVNNTTGNGLVEVYHLQ